MFHHHHHHHLDSVVTPGKGTSPQLTIVHSSQKEEKRSGFHIVSENMYASKILWNCSSLGVSAASAGSEFHILVVSWKKECRPALVLVCGGVIFSLCPLVFLMAGLKFWGNFTQLLLW